MKKSILTFIAMLLAGVNTVWGQNVAKIGEVEYATLQEALDAATSDGVTVTLLNDIDLGTGTATIASGKKVTLELGDFTITSTKLVISNKGELIVNSGTNGGMTSTTDAIINCCTNSKTTINGGTLNGTDGCIYTGKESGSTIIINDGTFASTQNAVVMTNGLDGYGNHKITINGGTFNGSMDDTGISYGYIACGIYAANNDEWNINGGTFNISRGPGIVQRAGIVNVTGGTFNCTGTNTGKVGDKDTALPSAALVYDNTTPNYPGESTNAVMNVTGGTFSSGENVAVVNGMGSGDHIEISGGTYNKAVDNIYCATDYAPVANGNGGYDIVSNYEAQIGGTKYTTLEEAITAATSGETITLLKNITKNTEIVIPTGKSFTLDLGGFTYTTSGNNGFNFDNTNTANSTMTVKNGTIDATSSNAAIRVGGNGNTLIVESDATINCDNTVCAIAVMHGETTANTVTIKGKVNATGTLEDGNFAISSNGLKTYKATINIEDGAELTSASNAAIYQPGGEDVTLNINGGTITGKTGVYIKSGTTNITGGTITGNGDQAAPTNNSNGANPTGDAVVVDHAAYPGSTPVVSITGGTFNSTNAQPIATYVTHNVPEEQLITGFVSGGTFNKEIDITCCKVGYFSKGSGTTYTLDGPYDAKIGDTGYATFAAAASAAGTNTIDLLRDIVAAYTMSENQTLSVKKNGYALTVNAPSGLEVAETTNSDGVTTYTLKKSVSGLNVTIAPATYTGAEQTPVVTVKDGGTTLEAGTHYTITTSSYINANTYSEAITITGIGDYAGVRKENFTIEPRNINDVTVTGNSFAYTGSAIEATTISGAITLTYGGATLSKADGGDYSITVATGTYKDPGTYPGVITLTAVEGAGKNFVGSRTIDLIIQEAINIADCDIVATTVYNGSNQTPTAGTTVKVYNSVTNTEIATENYTITVTGTDFVNAGTYANAVKVTGKGTCYGEKTVNYIITPKDIAECTIGNEKQHTGDVFTPAQIEGFVTVTDGNTGLTKGTHFNVTASSGYTYQDPDTYANAITVTGVGNYTGEVTKDFIIFSSTAKNLEGHTIVVSKQTYTGAQLDPTSATTIVTYDGTQLTAGTDYTFSFVPSGTVNEYLDAKEYSNAIIITGKGTNYYGTITADYVIEQRDLADAAVQATQENKMTWTGNEIAPVINVNNNIPTSDNVSLKLMTGVAPSANIYYLVANNDYTYTSDPTPIKEPGIYTITFEGRGNFKGTTQLTVNVLKSITAGTVHMWTKAMILPYQGTITAADLVVKDGDKTLVQGTDYKATIYETVENSTYTNEVTDIKEANTTYNGGHVYIVKLEGLGNSYGNNDNTDIRKEDLYVFNEYNEYNDNVVGDMDVHITDIENFLTATNSIDFTIKGKFGNQPQNSVIPTNTTDPFKPLNNPDISITTLGSNPSVAAFPITIVGIEKGAFKDCAVLQGIDLSNISTITDIEAGAFEGCKALRYINLTNSTAFTPNSLDRTVSGATFYGVPKQALVYLHGNTITGENYVYLKNGTEYVCDVFKIYDDVNGNQQGFTETDGYKWAYENLYPFTANTIENTRQLKAGQHYTVCLPYPESGKEKRITMDVLMIGVAGGYGSKESLPVIWTDLGIIIVPHIL